MGGDGLAPIELPQASTTVALDVKCWAEEEGYTTESLKSGANGAFLYLTAMSDFWGFVDDCAVQMTVMESGTPLGGTIVEAQCQLRFGESDINVNEKRIRRLWATL